MDTLDIIQHVLKRWLSWTLQTGMFKFNVFCHNGKSFLWHYLIIFLLLIILFAISGLQDIIINAIRCTIPIWIYTLLQRQMLLMLDLRKLRWNLEWNRNKIAIVKLCDDVYCIYVIIKSWEHTLSIWNQRTTSPHHIWLQVDLVVKWNSTTDHWIIYIMEVLLKPEKVFQKSHTLKKNRINIKMD